MKQFLGARAFLVDLDEKYRALVYLVAQSTTRAIYFPKKDTYGCNRFYLKRCGLAVLDGPTFTSSKPAALADLHIYQFLLEPRPQFGFLILQDASFQKLQCWHSLT